MCRGRTVANESGFPYILKALAAYQPHAIPRTERICRLSRVANLDYREMPFKLHALDAAVDYSSLEPVALTDKDLRVSYLSDTERSGISVGAPVVLCCLLKCCFFCGSTLKPAVDTGGYFGTCMERGEEHDIKLITEDGAVLCHEYQRECHSCSAVHFTSHAVQYGPSIGRGYSRPIVRAEPYAWRVVDVLRVHARRFYSAKVLDLAIRNYCKEFIPFHTSAATAIDATIHLQKPSTGDDINDRTFRRACTLRMLLFWREEVAGPLGDDSLLNLSEAFSSEEGLEKLLRDITRDNGFFDRGCIPRLHIEFALRHKHASSQYDDGRCAGDDGFAQDGNFDATYKKEHVMHNTTTAGSSSDEDAEESEDSDEYEDDDGPIPQECSICHAPLSEPQTVILPCSHKFHRACVEDLQAADAAQSCPVCQKELPAVLEEKTNRDEDGEDLEDQLSHPYIRCKLFLSASLLQKMRPGNVRVDARRLSLDLGYDSPEAPMLGIVAKGLMTYRSKGGAAAGVAKTASGLSFKRCIVVFPHSAYATDASAALKSKEFHFGANYIKATVGLSEASPASKIDYADLPPFMAVEGGDVDFPDNETLEREVTPGMVDSGAVAATDAEISKVCFSAGTAHACLAKENANPKVHSTRSNHVEGITYGCGMHVAISSFEGGEGSVSNGEQYADLILDHDRLGLDFPLRWYQDNACNQLRHLLMELARFCMGLACLNKTFNKEPWVLIMMLALDIVVDRYHFRVGHVEKWCRWCLSPEKRQLPEGTNTQSVS